MTVAPETISIPALALALGMARTTVSGRLQAANVAPAEHIKGYPRFRVGEALRAILAPSIAVDVDELSPTQRLHHFRAEELQRELSDMKAGLIPAEVADRHVERIEAVLADARAEIISALAKNLPPSTLQIAERHLNATDG